MIYHKSLNGVYYCFFISAKIEPFVIITAVCPLVGKLARLTEQQLVDLSSVLNDFKIKYGIVNETYHYTNLTERNADVDHSGRSDTKAHSAHFHLKMRIATKMMSDMFPVLRMINLPLLKEKLEPVQYCFSRVCGTYETIYQEMLKDTVSPILI
jgi:hypothetical protein